MRVCPMCGREFDDSMRFCPQDATELQTVVPAADALVGQVIADRYYLARLLGEGGMGRVYLADQLQFARQCAVKIIHPRLAHDKDAAQRFRREAANAARIIHSNVVTTYDSGETANGVLYLAMEFVPGESLGEIIARDGRLAPERAVELAAQVASGLVAAHNVGVVHRDLKPDNVLITRDAEGRECAKIVDFGVAKIAGSDSQDVTRVGQLIGTPAYMSPEQLAGEVVDGRSDLYSLGCLFYAMLTGTSPQSESTGESLIRRRLTEPAPRVRAQRPELSPGLDEFLACALAPHRDERFQNAVAFREALRRAMTADDEVKSFAAVSAPDEGDDGNGISGSRRPLRWTSISLVVVVASGLTALGMWLGLATPWRTIAGRTASNRSDSIGAMVSAPTTTKQVKQKSPASTSSFPVSSAGSVRDSVANPRLTAMRAAEPPGVSVTPRGTAPSQSGQASSGDTNSRSGAVQARMPPIVSAAADSLRMRLRGLRAKIALSAADRGRGEYQQSHAKLSTALEELQTLSKQYGSMPSLDSLNEEIAAALRSNADACRAEAVVAARRQTAPPTCPN